MNSPLGGRAQPLSPAEPLSPKEVKLLRDATPGCSRVIHFNHAGAALVSDRVLAAQCEHLELEANIGGYEAAEETIEANQRVYDSIGTLIGAEPWEIARQEHATAAWNCAFWSVPMQQGQRILTSAAAYGANAVGFSLARQRRGVRIEVLPSGGDGQVDLSALEQRVGSDVALIALTHIPTSEGIVNPAAEVGLIANGAEIPFLLDACQSVGHLCVDVGEYGVDMLSSTGRKYLRGPRGTGFLYVSDRIVDRLVPDRLDHVGAPWVEPNRFEFARGARRFEQFEYNHGGWLGLGVAVDTVLEIGIHRVEATIVQRASYLKDKLAESGLRTLDRGATLCGLLTVAIEGISATEVKHILRGESINVSVAAPLSSPLDAQRLGLHRDFVRLSLHYLTTETEIDSAVAALAKIAQRA